MHGGEAVCLRVCTSHTCDALCSMGWGVEGGAGAGAGVQRRCGYRLMNASGFVCGGGRCLRPAARPQEGSKGRHEWDAGIARCVCGWRGRPGEGWWLALGGTC